MAVTGHVTWKRMAFGCLFVIVSFRMAFRILVFVVKVSGWFSDAYFFV